MQCLSLPAQIQLLNYKRKISASFLVLIALLPVAVFLFQQVQIYVWKYEAFERFEKKHTITLTIASQDIKWEKKNKEAVINGSLFDVKKVEKTARGDYKLTGIFDRHEDHLKKIFDENLASQSSKKNQTHSVFFSFLYCDKINAGNDNCISYNETPVYTGYINSIIPHYMGDIFIPPPNC